MHVTTSGKNKMKENGQQKKNAKRTQRRPLFYLQNLIFVFAFAVIAHADLQQMNCLFIFVLGTPILGDVRASQSPPILKINKRPVVTREISPDGMFALL